mmetsp:Transcript_13571/g.15496  ORF Transcript_13571/g.15496 Transcript_13571/m.15496 type:complete len:139 (+) Transcript_13571:122-538(+)
MMRVASMCVLLLVAAALEAGANPTHYGDPTGGCMSDEKAVQVQGVSGDFCSPPCKGTSCPTDMPSGDTATPQCALQMGSGGSKYCALICDPSGNGDECGTGTCQSIQGLGICTYSVAEGAMIDATAVTAMAKSADMVV